MDNSLFETEIDCLTEISYRTLELLPEDWVFAGIDIVRHSDREFDSRGFFLQSPDGERHSFDVPDDIINLFADLARLGSTEEKGLYKKLRFTLTRDGSGQIENGINYDYDDPSEGFMGSNGVLIDAEFYNRKGVPRL